MKIRGAYRFRRNPYSIIAGVFFLVLILSGGNSLAGRFVISTLPDTLRQANHTADAVDTVTLAGTKVSSASSGLMLLFSSHNPLHGWYVDLGTDTLEFGTAGGAGKYGISIRNESGYPGNEITINGGFIIHNPPRNDDSTIRENTCLTFGGENIKLKNVNMIAGGWNGKCILGGQGYNIDIDGGIYRSNCNYYDSRCQFDAIMMNFGPVVFDPTYAASKGFTCNYEIRNIRIIDAPHAGIRLASTTGSLTAYAVVKIHDNQINIDARNYKYTSYAGTCLSSSNPYAIALQRPGPGSEIYNNTITSGTLHGGGRGILVETARGDSNKYMEIFNNNIDIHEGPNAEYDENHMETHAVRLRNDCTYIHVHHNTIQGTGDTDPATPSYGRSIAAIRYTFDGAYGGTNSFNLIENNLFRVRGLTSGVTAYAVCFDDVTIPDTTLIFRYNRLESDNILVKYGEINEGARGITIMGDTLSYLSPSHNPQTFVVGHSCNNWNCSNNYACDMVYENGASDQSITFTCSSNGVLEYGLQRRLRISVKGNNGLPVAGATVVATNNYGFVVINSTTDRLGRLVRPVVYKWESPSSDSTGFNNFTIKVRKGSDSTVISQTVSATSADPIITLSNTTGEEAIDSIPPSSIHDLSAVTGYNAGEIHLSWTAPGDDGEIGQANSYEVRYSLTDLNYLNWNGAASYSGVPTPSAAGTIQSLTMTGLQRGKMYYIAIKTSDAVGNISSISNTSSALAQVDLSLGGDDTLVAMLEPATGAVLGTSRPTLTVANVNARSSNQYYFEVAADTGFALATAASPPISQAAGSRTAWRVEARLAPGVVYYWRAKLNQNNYGDRASFTVQPETHAYPNPFKPVRGQLLTVTDIPARANLIILTVSGSTVKRWTGVTSGEVTWDGNNEEGNPVASGTYIWFVEGSSLNGKIVIIR